MPTQRNAVAPFSTLPASGGQARSPQVLSDPQPTSLPTSELDGVTPESEPRDRIDQTFQAFGCTSAGHLPGEDASSGRRQGVLRASNPVTAWLSTQSNRRLQRLIQRKPASSVGSGVESTPTRSGLG